MALATALSLQPFATAIALIVVLLVMGIGPVYWIERSVGALPSVV